MPLSDSTALFNDAVAQFLIPNAKVCSQQASYTVVKQLARNRSSVIGVLEPYSTSPKVGAYSSDELLACKIYESCTEGIKEEMMSRSLCDLGIVPDIVDSFFYVPKSYSRANQELNDHANSKDESSSSEEDLGRQSPPYGVHVNVFRFLNTPLRRLVDRIDGPLQSSTISQLATELVRCVVALHASGVVHGDIETGNIFITSDGSIRLGDFGASARFPEVTKFHSLETPARQSNTQLFSKQFEDASIDTVLNSSVEETAIRRRSPSTSPSRSICSELLPPRVPYLGSIFNLPPEALPWIMLSLRNVAKNQSLRRIVDRRLADDGDCRSYARRLQSTARFIRPKLSKSGSRLRQVFGVISNQEMELQIASVCRAPPLVSSHEDSCSVESRMSKSDQVVDDQNPPTLAVTEIVNATAKISITEEGVDCVGGNRTELLKEVDAPDAENRYIESPKTLSIDDDAVDSRDDHFIDYVDLSYLLGDPTFRYNLLMSEDRGYDPTSAADIWQIGSVVLEMVLGCSVLQLVSMFGEECDVGDGSISGVATDGDVQIAKPPMRPALLIEEQLSMITSESFIRQFIQSLQAERKLSSVCADFILLCLTPDPDQRPSAVSLLRHEFINPRGKLADRDKIVVENLKAKISNDQHIAKVLQILQVIIQRQRDGDNALEDNVGPADKIMQIFRNISNVLKKPSTVTSINRSPCARAPKDLSMELLRSTASGVGSLQATATDGKRENEDAAGGWLVPNGI